MMRPATTVALAILSVLILLPLASADGRHGALPGDADSPLELGHLGPYVTTAPEPIPIPMPGPDGTYTDGHEQIMFRCPDPPTGSPLGITGGGISSDVVVYGCPYKVYDDTHPFGNPQIVVNDMAPSEIAFCGLHDPGPNNPDHGTHEYSRIGQTHVTFTTNNQGHSWQDQPIAVGSGMYGDMADCTMDSTGNLYIAYLWSIPYGSGENRTYGAEIGLYKAGTTAEQGGVLNSYRRDDEQINSRGPQNPIDFVHILRVDAAFIPDYNDTLNRTANEEEEWNANGTKNNETGPGEVGEFAVNGTDVPETIVVSWFEQGPDFPAWTENGEARTVPTYEDEDGTKKSGWIDFAWTDPSSNAEWMRLHDDQAIGPCRDASNPVQYEGKVYVACQVGKGYEHRSRARIGDIDIWKFDPQTGETKFVSQVPTMVGGRLNLAANPDGYMVISNHWIPAPDAPEAPPVPQVEVAFGWYGGNWNYVGNIGPALHQYAGGRVFLDADVTALSVSQRDKTALLMYKEWHPPTSPERTEALLETEGALQDYTKIVISLNQCDNIIAGRQVVTGTGINPYQLQAYQNNPGVFNDQQDGLWWTIDPMTGEELWYFAINDYGAMQVGAIVTAASSDAFCQVPPPLVQLPPAPLPQALTTASGITNAIGATLGVGATAMVGYLLLNRRKAPSAVAAEDQ